MFNKIVLAVAAMGFAVAAFAADTDEKAIREAVQGLAPGIKVDSIQPAPMAGFSQVIASGQLVYVSNDGKYMMHGNLIDLKDKKDLSEQAWATVRKAAIAKIPASQKLVFGPANPKHTVTVFTDVDCGFCRELHKHMDEYNKQGIAVEYLFWPREGVKTTAGNDTPSYTKAVSVWCSADRKTAFTDAISGKSIKPMSCKNPVSDDFDLGVNLGVNGTPTVVAEDGTVIGGYVTPAQMMQALNATKASPATAPAPN